MNHNIRFIDSHEIETIESPGTGVPVFLFHGNSGSADSYSLLLESELGRTNRLIAVSFPGHGGSSRAKQPELMYNIEALGYLAAKVTESFGFDKYFLVGQSVGGHAILEALSEFKNAIGLVLSSSPPISLETFPEAFRPDPTDGLLFSQELTDDEARKLASCFFSKLTSTHLPQAIHNINLADPKFRSTLGRSLSEGKLKNEIGLLEGSQIPTAMFGSDNDAFLNEGYYRTQKFSNLWRGKPYIFTGAGHLLYLESPDVFEGLLKEFMCDVLEKMGNSK